jgi:pimeloyl-ACP methyl ester carboxylesterase
MSAEAFKIAIPQATLDDLRERLGHTRWPDEITGADWGYGTNLAYLQSLVDYWQHNFDWRAQEQAINRFAHFRANIDGFHIHFIHERGKGPHPLPLLLLHGWPSSFVQMLKILPLLTDPSSYGGDPSDSFDVIVASLPGYGFSDRPTRPGMNAGQMAELFARLMTDVLGYNRYAARGTDIGAGVVFQLAFNHPESLIGLHTGGTLPRLPATMPDNLTEAEKEYISNVQHWMSQEGAYAMLHATKPQTLAYGLNDSPTGLAGWIIEKFRAWSDCDGDVEKAFTRDELLTNLTIYWATETINSSIRVYYETTHNPNPQGRVTVPMAWLQPPKDLFPMPRSWVERIYTLDRWTELPAGGHFPEWEQPEAVANDIRTFFHPLRQSS